MKFNGQIPLAAAIAVVLVLAVGFSQMGILGQAPSFREQLSQLIQARRNGIISEAEYVALRCNIVRVMLH